MITILMPALNEEGQLETAAIAVLDAAKEAGDLIVEIIIVNDGSTDRTGVICEILCKRYSQIYCIDKVNNEGLAAAVRDGLKKARYEKFMSVPGSGDMDKDLLVKLFSCASNADVVLAYYLNREIRGRVRTSISYMFAAIYMWTFNVFVQYITGPAIYPTRILKTLDLKAYGFSIFPEMTVKTLRSGVSYLEIAGYMHERAGDRSTAVSTWNFIEVFVTYIRLFVEINITKRNSFKLLPVRKLL